jgi:autotransporter-associated beta strand protein
MNLRTSHIFDARLFFGVFSVLLGSSSLAQTTNANTVTKASGSGNLSLSGANTFSGKVTVISGRLDATGVSDSVGSGLGQGTQVELGSGANLQVNVGAGTTNTTTRALIFNGSGTLGNPGSGPLVWNGSTTVNAATATTINFNSLAGGTVTYDVLIPPNTTATFIAPDGNQQKLGSGRHEITAKVEMKK